MWMAGWLDAARYVEVVTHTHTERALWLNLIHSA